MIMDVLDEVMLSHIDHLKYWSGIMTINTIDKADWPSRMIFRFAIASSMCYEIVGKHVLEDLHSPFSFFDLYSTGTWKVKGFDEPVFIREKICENRPIDFCLKKAKEDYEAMLKENERKRDSDDSNNLS